MPALGNHTGLPLHSIIVILKPKKDVLSTSKKIKIESSQIQAELSIAGKTGRILHEMFMYFLS